MTTAPLEELEPATSTAGRIPAVAVQAVSKSFGSVRAVDGVVFDVEQGGVHGLLGPNGAGKTTLLRMILGLVRPDAGAVRVFGRSPADRGGALHGVAGFVETPRFYPYLTATRNLDLLAALDGPGTGPSVDEALATVGLAGQAGRKVGTFSTGMQQRLGLAAALLRDPRLLVLDEPTNGLDPAGLADLHALVRTLAASGRTVLLSSHHMAEIDDLCDAVTILRAGHLVHSGTLADLRAEAPAPRFLLQTSDDPAATQLGAVISGVTVEPTGAGLLVRAHPSDMDAYVLALGAARVAVRALTRRDTALEALFARLTTDDAVGGGSVGDGSVGDGPVGDGS